MESAAEYWAARAALEWQAEMGVDEAQLDAPVDRYALADEAPKMRSVAVAEKAPVLPEAVKVDPVAEARGAAELASDLEGLRAAMEAFAHCDLRRGAKSLVFCDGNPDARVMIVGEAPGREEDIAGRPFVGRAGQLLDRMLAAIDLGRAHPAAERSVYITNVMPWRPPSNRTPDAGEIAMMLPFLERHIALVDPDIVLIMGNTPMQALLGKTGITKLRGQIATVLGKPAMPMLHPAYLLRQPAAKRETWADLLAVNAFLRGDRE